MRKTVVIDDDGNEIPAPDPDSDVGRVIYLLEYARKRGFAIPTVQIGDTIVQVRDLRQEAAMRKDAPKMPDDPDMAIILARGSE